MNYRQVVGLGAGGMARVQLAISEGKPGFTKLIVVKELKPELLDEPEFVKMFLDEARLSARLTHPNIVQTYDVIQTPTQLALLMEYVEGVSLAGILKRVKRTGFPLALNVRVLSDMLLGLHYAHELADFDGQPLNVVHRDVSPHNVMIDYGGHVKLLDFGIAKARGAMTQTAEGVIKGKIVFMAPECIFGRPIDRRADVFSVGIMLWEAITKQRAGGGRPEAEIAAMRVSGAEPKAAEHSPDCDPSLLAACERALQVEPEQRFESALAFKEALDAYLTAQGEAGSSKALAQFVKEQFSDERERVRAIVAERTAATTSAPEANREVPNIMTEEQSSSTALRTMQISSAALGSAPAPKRNRWLTTLLLAVFGGVMIGGTIVYMRRPAATTDASLQPSSVGSAQPSGRELPSETVAPTARAEAVGSDSASPVPEATSSASAAAGSRDEGGKKKHTGSAPAPSVAAPTPPPAAPPTSAPTTDGMGNPISTTRKPRDIDPNNPYAR